MTGSLAYVKGFQKRAPMMKNLFIRIGVVFLALALVSGSASAQAGDGGISFGIRPTKAYEDRPETFSYFSYELTPGAQVTDEALVMNSGSVPIILKLYAADGITAQNGGTAFTEQGKTSTGGSQGVSGWISLPVNEIALQPGQEVTVPFTLNVPPDATPGHHVAGLVVEALPGDSTSTNGGEGEAQFAVNVIHRVGVAVVVDVPGPHVAGLEITGASLKEQNDQGATFVIAVHNVGNIFTKTEGFLMVTDTKLQPLATIPVSLDTILPGDATIFYITYPVHFSDSNYLLHVSVSLSDDGGTAWLGGVEMKVRDGQPAIEGDVGESLLPPIITEIFSPKPGFDLKSFIVEQWKIILFAFIMLIFILIFLRVRFVRRRKQP